MWTKSYHANSILVKGIPQHWLRVVAQDLALVWALEWGRFQIVTCYRWSNKHCCYRINTQGPTSVHWWLWFMGSTRYEDLTAVLQRIHVFWDVKLCHWASGPRHSEGSDCPHLQASGSPKQVVFDCFSPEDDGNMILQNAGKASPNDPTSQYSYLHQNYLQNSCMVGLLWNQHTCGHISSRRKETHRNVVIPTFCCSLLPHIQL